MTNLNPKKHLRPFAFFMTTNATQMKWIILNIICYSIATLASVGISFYLGKVVDTATSGGNSKFFVILLISAIFAREIFYRLGHVLEVIVDARIREKTKKALFMYTTKLSFGYFADRFAGQISHQIGKAANALEKMKDIITNKFIDNTWMIVVSTVVAASVYPLLGIIMAVWTLLFALGIRPFVRKLTEHAEEFAKKESDTTGILVDMYSNITTVKAYGKDFDQNRVYAQINNEYVSQKALGKWSVLTYAYQGLSASILGVALLIATSYGYMHGLISIGDIVIIASVGIKILSDVYETGGEHF